MRGRFGVGAAAGLALGILIIMASGFSTGLYGSFTASPTLVATYTAASSTMAGLGSQAPQSANSSRANIASHSYYGFLTPATRPGGSPSSLNLIASQPPLVDVVILLPVVVAIVLGVIAYRTGTGRAGDEEEREDSGP